MLVEGSLQIRREKLEMNSGWETEVMGPLRMGVVAGKARPEEEEGEFLL